MNAPQGPEVARILLVRHGEAFGPEGADPKLSVVGRHQILSLATRLHNTGIVAVWHGPKRRAAESGQLVADQLHVETWCTELLEDRTPVPSTDRRADYPAHRWSWLDNVPTAERDEDGITLSAAWGALQARARGSTVLMVTHAFVVSWFLAQVMEAPPAAWMRMRVSSTGVSELEADVDQKYVIRRMNDTAHLHRSDPDPRQSFVEL